VEQAKKKNSSRHVIPGTPVSKIPHPFLFRNILRCQNPKNHKCTEASVRQIGYHTALPGKAEAINERKELKKERARREKKVKMKGEKMFSP
jgi:hypothetical protein